VAWKSSLFWYFMGHRPGAMWQRTLTFPYWPKTLIVHIFTNNADEDMKLTLLWSGGTGVSFATAFRDPAVAYVKTLLSGGQNNVHFLSGSLLSIFWYKVWSPETIRGLGKFTFLLFWTKLKGPCRILFPLKCSSAPSLPNHKSTFQTIWAKEYLN
jgi:hypothetical protein